ATVVTPYTRRKGKETMVESKTLKKKKIQEQMNIQMARQLEEEMERDAQRMNEQIARDTEIARIYAKKELQIMIDRLDSSNETVAKYQDNYAKVYKFQTQQRKPWSKKQKRNYYMAVIKNNLCWKVKEFRGMTFEEIEAKFTTVWKQLKYCIPIGSKEEAERFKRKGIRLYDTCGVHHVTAKDKEIFMLVAKYYPLRKGLAIGMISYKLQVENYSRMANDLILKIYKIANTPRQQGD
nr:hypothetical protein [Tanacetum cinerariifolium]